MCYCGLSSIAPCACPSGRTKFSGNLSIEQREDKTGNKADLYHQRQILLETANIRKHWLTNSVDDSLPFCS